MDKIEIDIEVIQEIQKELRNNRLANMEFHNQLTAIKRLLMAIELHLPTEKEVSYVPPVMAKINEAIQKAQKKELADEKKAKLEDKSEKAPVTKKKP